ncbi:MAG: asparagine synthase (glutamine-hydrolyzing) [Alphaproteobacteria bacterium]|nr:asparagine synthase (glutamine-hydrolyzing) [Alphaproteobacteria bacterium]
MCGIVGLYNLPREASHLQQMLESIAHRGPDAQGVYEAEVQGADVRLGHRRLSIIDLSDAANQPFEKDGLVVVFNGEIYNYKQLAKELESLGVRFRTSSDTEVLLEAWRTWGPDSLNRLRGMFAFALLEKKTGRLILARDPFGIKPLFFARRNGGLAFASELKALRIALGNDLKLDATALVSSLMYYWIPEGHCVYKGVDKLPPGCWAEISPNGAFAQHCYYNPQRELIHDSYKDIDVATLRRTIEESVAAHMVADVPVSAFLSGGLDSSLITVIAAQQGHQIEGYTISFRDEDRRLEAMPDDLFYARKIAEAHNLKLHEIEIAPDIADMLPRMVSILDEPIGDAAAINAYLICKAARDVGVKVLLSGMGADELFGGYRKHLACMLATQYRQVPRFLRDKVVAPTVNGLPVARKNKGYRTVRWAKRFLAFADMPEEAGFRRSYTHYGVPEFHDLLSPDLYGSVDALVDEHAALYNQYREANCGDQVNSMCYTDVRHFLPGLNLAYTDRASMAASTEVRVPYVDREVVAAAFAIAGRYKIAGRQTKAILKKAAEAWLPREVIYRPKGLFSAPLRAWIRRDLQEMVEDLLMQGTMVKAGFLNGGYLRKMVDEDRAGTADRSKEIWQLMTLESWLQQQSATL